MAGPSSLSMNTAAERPAVRKHMRSEPGILRDGRTPHAISGTLDELKAMVFCVVDQRLTAHAPLM
eukprot:11606650-Alexandrium_andersonii.AAC.1